MVPDVQCVGEHILCKQRYLEDAWCHASVCRGSWEAVDIGCHDVTEFQGMLDIAPLSAVVEVIGSGIHVC